MDLDEAAALIAGLARDPDVLPEFSRPQVSPHGKETYLRIEVGEGLVVDLMPVGDGSEYLVLEA